MYASHDSREILVSNLKWNVKLHGWLDKEAFYKCLDNVLLFDYLLLA